MYDVGPSLLDPGVVTVFLFYKPFNKISLWQRAIRFKQLKRQVALFSDRLGQQLFCPTQHLSHPLQDKAGKEAGSYQLQQLVLAPSSHSYQLLIFLMPVMWHNPWPEGCARAAPGLHLGHICTGITWAFNTHCEILAVLHFMAKFPLIKAEPEYHI